MLDRVDRVGFHLNYVVSRQSKNSFQPAGNIHRREGIEIVRQLVALRQRPIDLPAVPAVESTLLAKLEAEIPSGYGPGGKKFPPKHVCAQMHVMVAVDSLRRLPVNSLKFLDLAAHHIFKRTPQPGMEHDLCEPAAAQVLAYPLMMLA